MNQHPANFYSNFRLKYATSPKVGRKSHHYFLPVKILLPLEVEQKNKNIQKQFLFPLEDYITLALNYFPSYVLLISNLWIPLGHG